MDINYIVESWIKNLDVEPYKIDIEEATEYAGYFPGLASPEKIMETWNRIIDEEAQQ